MVTPTTKPVGKTIRAQTTPVLLFGWVAGVRTPIRCTISRWCGVNQKGATTARTRITRLALWRRTLALEGRTGVVNRSRKPLVRKKKIVIFLDDAFTKEHEVGQNGCIGVLESLQETEKFGKCAQLESTRLLLGKGDPIHSHIFEGRSLNRGLKESRIARRRTRGERGHPAGRALRVRGGRNASLRAIGFSHCQRSKREKVSQRLRGDVNSFNRIRATKL